MSKITRQTLIGWLLVIALLLTGPATVLAQGGDEITLVPFTNEAFQIQGVVPEGWSMAAPGVYARGAHMGDLTSLIMQAAPGMTIDSLVSLLLHQLSIDALPEPIGVQETAAYTWTVYQVPVNASGFNIMIDLALAETETGVTLVLLQTLAGDYEALHEAVFVPALEALAPLEAARPEAETGGGRAGIASTYEDPEGRFSVPVPTNWTVEVREGYTYLYSPNDLIGVSIVVVEGEEDPEAAREQAWQIVDPAFDRELTDTVQVPSNELDNLMLYTYRFDEAEGLIYQVVVYVLDGTSTALIYRADLTDAQQRAAQLQIIDSGFEIAGMEKQDIAGVEPAPLADDTIAALEAYIADTMARYQTPGAAVAIVQNGAVVYAGGFGQRDPAGDPVTADTLMMIGSTTKTFTTLLMAQLVDEGLMTWDTPVTEILPTFRVADPDVTGRITMENMVCACTGVPRRDLEFIFQGEEITPQGVIASLADFTFFTDFGEAFQYSNQMVAAGGYLAALAAGGSFDTVYQDYTAQIQSRILDPLDMERTTFSFDAVQADADHAAPYSLALDFTYTPLPLAAEEMALYAVAPAGLLWSSANDMAEYLIMQLNQGVAADGTRIVSAENLDHTRQPQIAITATDSYGLGWIISDFYGQPMLSHAGNTLGFSSEFAFLPEADLGIVVLTNQQGSLLNSAVRDRLFELLFGLSLDTDARLEMAYTMLRSQLEKNYEKLTQTIDDATAAIAGGTYTSDALGEIVIARQADGTLTLDAGAFQSALWLYTPDEEEQARTPEGQITLQLADPPLAGMDLTWEPVEDGYQLKIGAGTMEYRFERVS